MHSLPLDSRAQHHGDNDRNDRRYAIKGQASDALDAYGQCSALHGGSPPPHVAATIADLKQSQAAAAAAAATATAAGSKDSGVAGGAALAAAPVPAGAQ